MAIRKFGEIIREYRIKSHMTQAQLAASLGYDSPQFISLLERGTSKTPLVVLGQLIVILGIDEEIITRKVMEEFQACITAEIAVGKNRAATKK